MIDLPTFDGPHFCSSSGTSKICGVNWNGDPETMPAAAVPARSAWTGITARQPPDPAELVVPTTSWFGKMIMTVFGSVAEFERSLILKRTQEGREAAKARASRSDVLQSCRELRRNWRHRMFCTLVYFRREQAMNAAQ